MGRLGVAVAIAIAAGICGASCGGNTPPASSNPFLVVLASAEPSTSASSVAPPAASSIAKPLGNPTPPAFRYPPRKPPGPAPSDPLQNSSAVAKLFASLKPTDPQWVVQGRRVARLLRKAEVDACDHARDAKAKGDDKALATALVAYERARADGIAVYKLIIEKRPDAPNGDDDVVALADEYGDRVVFDASGEALVAADHQAALRHWLELIQRFPSSKYVPIGYRMFADSFFDDASKGASDWKVAEEAYARALKSGGPPSNEEWPYLETRLGYVRWNERDAKGAKSAFEAAIEAATNWPAIPFASEIAADAQGALSSL